MKKRTKLEKAQDAIQHLQLLIEKKQEELSQLEAIYLNLKTLVEE